METRHLIDAVVQQTTLLIAQLATHAGIRAPMAHIADQVFLELAREIEHQGVPRSVAADMFGLALRSYQKKVNRLGASATQRGQPLWQAVLGYVTERGSARRAQVIKSFASDDEAHVIAVLNDLVASGLLFSTGRGQQADTDGMSGRYSAAGGWLTPLQQVGELSDAVSVAAAGRSDAATVVWGDEYGSFAYRTEDIALFPRAHHDSLRRRGPQRRRVRCRLRDRRGARPAGGARLRPRVVGQPAARRVVADRPFG